MLKSKFEDIISYITGKSIIITSHDLVDIDGLVSCIALDFFIQNVSAKAFYVQNLRIDFSSLSLPARTFINKFRKKFSLPLPPTFMNNIKGKLKEENIVLILDTNNLSQVSLYNKLTDPEKPKVPFIFIDHHIKSTIEYDGNINLLNIIADEYSSTAELIYEIYKAFDMTPNYSIKALLMCGILTDTGFFKYGNNNTIKTFAELTDENIDLQDLFSLLKYETDISERIAIIKGSQRAKLIKVDQYLIGVSNVSSFEASAASALLNLGFDVSIVYSEKKSGFRISTRAKKHICLEKGLHLGKILEELSDGKEVTGGGHDGAASINGSNDGEKILDRIVDGVKEILNTQEL